MLGVECGHYFVAKIDDTGKSDIRLIDFVFTMTLRCVYCGLEKIGTVYDLGFGDGRKLGETYRVTYDLDFGGEDGT